MDSAFSSSKPSGDFLYLPHEREEADILRLKKAVHRYLLEMGFMPLKYGFFMLQHILTKGLLGEKILPLNTAAYKELSQSTARSVAAIEKDIQNSISDAWLRGKIELLYRDFGETIDMRRGKPTNKHFILTVIEFLKFRIN